MMPAATALPKLKINKFRQVEKYPTVDKFRDACQDTNITLEVKLAPDGHKYFMIGSVCSWLGWTSDPTTAFQFLNNACAYTYAELCDAARGKLQ